MLISCHSYYYCHDRSGSLASGVRRREHYSFYNGALRPSGLTPCVTEEQGPVQRIYHRIDTRCGSRAVVAVETRRERLGMVERDSTVESVIFKKNAVNKQTASEYNI